MEGTQCLIAAAGWKADPKIMSQRHSWPPDDDHDDHYDHGDHDDHDDHLKIFQRL